LARAAAGSRKPAATSAIPRIDFTFTKHPQDLES
jgi:hypothetical protein